MGKYKYINIYIYIYIFIFIDILRKKNVPAEEPKTPHSKKCQIPVFLLPCLAPELQLVLQSLLQLDTTALVILNP